MPFLKVNNKTLHHTDSKPAAAAAAGGNAGASRATVVFVHGLGSTQNYFFPILPYLRDGYRCVVFDNYGAGRSKYDDGEGREEEEHSIEGMGRDVLGILDGLEIKEAIVAGYSMGGMVPSLLASTAPDRVLAGICIGPVHPGPAVAEVFRKRVGAVREGGMEVMANTIPNAATGSKATPLQRAFIREMLMAQPVEGYVANCQVIERAVPPDYAGVRCPMLIIAGEEDKSAPLAGCERIFAELGTKAGEKRLEVLDGVGHWHCVEDGERVGRLVREFCDGLTI